MNSRIIKALLILLLLADLFYSLVQHYHLPLDGDMACIIMPSDGYKHLMSDPLGISALKGEIYSGTNRFFAHWTMSTYFRTVPLACQLIVNPIDSIYLSGAIAKLGIQIFIILLLAVYITRSFNVFSNKFLLTAVLIAPLFQSWGFNSYIGIIDKSVTYTFFYALPLSLLMLFFLPFYLTNGLEPNRKLNFWLIIALVPFALFLSLNGPLVPAVVLIVCPILLVYKWWVNFRESAEIKFYQRTINAIRGIPNYVLFLFIFISVLCLYSLYIGRLNAENFIKTIPLSERYLLLAKGFYFQFSKSLGSILLALIVIVNGLLIFKQRGNEEAKSIITALKWIIVFASIYTVLLPFGGYRVYRPFIIRSDTFMPVNLCLFFFYGISTIYLIKHYSAKLKALYLSVIIGILMVYTLADKTDYNATTCEKESLKIIAKSPEKIVFIENECSIMAWGKILDYKDSRTNTLYLELVGVLKEEKYYYQK